MVQFRKDRVAELIREAMADIILLKVKDPRVQGLTITRVQMAGDLKSARIFFASLADGRNTEHKSGLEAAQGFIRRELGRELDLKYVPQLSFFYDESFDHYDNINRILKQVIPPEPEHDRRDNEDPEEPQ